MLITLISEMMMMMLTTSLAWVSSNKSPYFLMIGVLMVTMMTSKKLMDISNNLWISLLFLMLMLGGLMVMFLYLISLMPKQTNLNLSLTPIITWMIMTLYILSQNKSTNYKNLNTQPMYNMFMYYEMTSIMILYLLITLFTVTYLSNFSKGPIQMNEKYN